MTYETLAELLRRAVAITAINQDRFRILVPKEPISLADVPIELILRRQAASGVPSQIDDEYGDYDFDNDEVAELLQKRWPASALLIFNWDGGMLSSQVWVYGIDVGDSRCYVYVSTEGEPHRFIAAIEPREAPIDREACGTFAFSLLRDARQLYKVDLFGSLPSGITNCRPDLVPRSAVFAACLQWLDTDVGGEAMEWLREEFTSIRHRTAGDDRKVFAWYFRRAYSEEMAVEDNAPFRSAASKNHVRRRAGQPTSKDADGYWEVRATPEPTALLRDPRTETGIAKLVRTVGAALLAYAPKEASLRLRGIALLCVDRMLGFAEEWLPHEDAEARDACRTVLSKYFDAQEAGQPFTALADDLGSLARFRDTTTVEARYYRRQAVTDIGQIVRACLELGAPDPLEALEAACHRANALFESIQRRDLRGSPTQARSSNQEKTDALHRAAAVAKDALDVALRERLQAIAAEVTEKE